MLACSYISAQYSYLMPSYCYALAPEKLKSVILNLEFGPSNDIVSIIAIVITIVSEKEKEYLFLFLCGLWNC